MARRSTADILTEVAKGIGGRAEHYDQEAAEYRQLGMKPQTLHCAAVAEALRETARAVVEALGDDPGVGDGE